VLECAQAKRPVLAGLCEYLLIVRFNPFNQSPSLRYGMLQLDRFSREFKRSKKTIDPFLAYTGEFPDGSTDLSSCSRPTTMMEPQPVWAWSQHTGPPNRFYGTFSLALESTVVIISLTLSLVSQPYHLRTILWAAGAEHGWNSDPHERVYFYANYKTPPPVPFVWSEEYGCNAYCSAYGADQEQDG
jgi:hypothetical protein